MSDLLEVAFAELVPPFGDETADWPDVVRRSAPRRERAQIVRRHPRRALIFVLAVLLIALLATPAFGVQSYVLHLLGRRNVSFANSPKAPNIVKKQFLDMPVGAPAQWNTPVQAAKARVVGGFVIAGHPRKLFVAPTTKGGYCYTFEKSLGGCRQTQKDRAAGRKGQFGVTWEGGSPRRGVNASIVTRIAGDITARAARSITARYADGTTDDIPFVWVSAPIAAGFYSFDVPTRHWARGHRLVSVTLYAKDGRELGHQAFPYEARPRQILIPPPMPLGLRHQRILPIAPSVPPTGPIQDGSADGFKVIVGHNGAVQFRQIGQTPILRELAGHSVSYTCTRFTREFGIPSERGLGESGRLAPSVGFVLSGVGTPIDVCEVQASIGRTWPDRLNNRAAVEIPLTPKGRRFLADRQAARDLALFVRSRRMQQLRKEPASQAKRDILKAYRKPLARSPIRIVVVDHGTIAFSERSTTGKLFTVTVHDGRIRSTNLKPYAFVF